MKILVGWDDPAEAELISLYLNSNDNECVVLTSGQEFLHHAQVNSSWDVVLMTITLPDMDSFQVFQQLHRLHPHCPIVGACPSDKVIQLAKFLRAGMRTYLLRDLSGDFVFLLQTTLESTVQAVEAEQELRVAEQMREEIESVRKFQDSVITSELYSPPGYRVAGRYECSQIRVSGGESVVLAGGDYYDVFQLDANRAGILIGDAAGHGMRACMSIIIVQTLIETLNPKTFKKPEDFIGELNRQFCRQPLIRSDGSLVTLFYGVLRFDRHELRWTTAGHPIPILQNRLEGQVFPIAQSDVTGPPLGVDAGFRYESQTTSIPPGGRLVLFTDGLVEASPDETHQHQFGFEGLKRTLAQECDRNPEQVVQSLMDKSDEFTRGAGRHDDTSVVLLERE
ncbi:MAG: hypothetical protein Tsb009_14990 [Planctomycetaceae bacterium]